MIINSIHNSLSSAAYLKPTLISLAQFCPKAEKGGGGGGSQDRCDPEAREGGGWGRDYQIKRQITV